MTDVLSRPTRLSRAIAFFVDGGFALLFLTQALSIAMYLEMNLADEELQAELDVPALLRGYGIWLAALAFAIGAAELSAHLPRHRAAGSFGFAIAGLAMTSERPRGRSALRRIPRVALPMLTMIAGAAVYAFGPTLIGIEEALAINVHLFRVGVVVAFWPPFVDALLVLGNPAARTVGDYLAGTRVVTRAPTRALVSDACRGAAGALRLLVALTLASFVEAYATDSFVAVLPAVTAMAGYLAIIACGSAFALLFDAASRPLDAVVRGPFLAGLFSVIPVVNVFFLRARVGRISAALDIPHGDALALRGLLDLGTVGISASFLQRMATASATSAPEVLSLSTASTIVGGAGMLALAQALSKLAELDLSLIIDEPAPKAPDDTLEKVFA